MARMGINILVLADIPKIIKSLIKIEAFMDDIKENIKKIPADARKEGYICNEILIYTHT